MSTLNVIIYKISKIIYKYRPLFFGAEFEAEFEIYITRAAFVKIIEKQPVRVSPGLLSLFYADGLLKDHFSPDFARINIRNTFFAHKVADMQRRIKIQIPTMI